MPRKQKAKKYERQTYSEIIGDLLKFSKERQNQYNKYLHTIQQEKMKELWGSKEDDDWGPLAQ